jgi:hypothetical protein
MILYKSKFPCNRVSKHLVGETSLLQYKYSQELQIINSKQLNGLMKVLMLYFV